ncbi:SIR2 family protein [Mesobacillus maritimus]|uniref:SIR2 family protein n=1 Tax=Mesobacillus maritimus TaxID=1643336 RepID=UPI00203C02E3|nr:SIR2 family protein [Mesobacillus maritimus]MCM3671081.1 SIR2 family protein [Mesobacillus maritimus]
MADKVIEEIRKYIESGNVNFIIGAGASIGAINTLGNFENDITTLIRDFQSDNLNDSLKIEIVNKLNEFLQCSIVPNQNLINRTINVGTENITYTLNRYKEFIRVVYKLLLLRGSDRLPKKINIFTTNYDLFFEYACEELRVAYNDGGFGIIRRVFSSKNFQKRIYQLSDSYSFEYETPVINLIKLHGSINWLLDYDQNDILIENKICLPTITLEHIDEKGFFNEETNIPIILPTKQKFNRTLMEHTYYDLARFFSNEMEREHSVLFCFGFSFADEHIRSITQRALGNPSMTLLIFPFSYSDEISMINYFRDFHNVKVIRVVGDADSAEGRTINYAKEGMSELNRQNIDFNTFIDIFNEILNQVESV